MKKKMTAAICAGDAGFDGLRRVRDGDHAAGKH